ncbi:hypothetical protein C7B65_10385 [Phormidesmis priestleyi ULC007]|uniref:Uncharacterized protein n=1 Tax=Phormidesmis priestleyi ULC007 TaxID=1920490 RepID=A0A2T1DGS0_9CYAN|nr:hypothetical protein C7B65_10385 [Phormidesmis priestleyi ULC007]PZO53576.1 MAG: hypothetical protein DCF14_04090 [Phormidesmis priestleyi]
MVSRQCFKTSDRFVAQRFCPLNPPFWGTLKGRKSPRMGDLGGFQGLKTLPSHPYIGLDKSDCWLLR